MSSEIRFDVLGPLRGQRADTALGLGSPQQQAVLAMLLLSRGRQVPVDRLIDGVWGNEPPRSAAGTVRTYVSRLRQCLGLRSSGVRGDLIAAVADGYQLRLEPAVLDLERFETMTADAHRAWQEGQAALAAELLRHALGLWRGRPLAGLPGPYAEASRSQLADLYTTALVDRLSIDIATGAYARAITELRALLGEHPFREDLGELLMLALYKAGRQADALGVFEGMRHRLRDELGVGPGPGLREVHRRILQADDRLADPADLRALRLPGVGRPGVVTELIVA